MQVSFTKNSPVPASGAVCVGANLAMPQNGLFLTELNKEPLPKSDRKVENRAQGNSRARAHSFESSPMVELLWQRLPLGFRSEPDRYHAHNVNERDEPAHLGIPARHVHAAIPFGERGHQYSSV